MATYNNKRVVHYERSYEFTSEIEFVAEGERGEFWFNIERRLDENFWSPAEDECCVLVEDGVIVGYEGYSEYPNETESTVMSDILREKQIIK